jgi:ribonucleoside-diphosphate reductase beta chain
MAIENIHSETYSLLIDTYFKEANDKEEALNAINYMPCIKKKADWCFKWINDESAPFSQRLLAFALVEGVFFSGAFCSIFWLKERGLMPGLSFSNELISRDEGMHVEFAVLLYSKIIDRLPQETVHQIVKEAVEVEKNFIIESIPCSMLGMNADLMSIYIEFVADRLLTQLNYEKIWNSNNPFPFMDRISIESKSNFFESRVSQYSKANVGGKQEHSKLRTFSLEADF